MRKPITVILFFLFVHLQSSAQFYPDYELGIGGGIAVYQGDLSPHSMGSFKKPGGSFQAFLNLNLSPSFSLRGQFAHASIKENEQSYGSHHQYRNFAFETSINEFSAQVVFNPFQNNGTEEMGSLIPYAFAGAGIGFLSVKRDFSSFDHSYPYWQTWVRSGLTQDSLTLMPASTTTLPIGLGLKYMIGEKISLYAEGSHRVVRSEYLDGFSKAANQTNKDAFSTLIIGLIFKLSEGGRGPGGYACPVNVF